MVILFSHNVSLRIMQFCFLFDCDLKICMCETCFSLPSLFCSFSKFKKTC